MAPSKRNSSVSISRIVAGLLVFAVVCAIGVFLMSLIPRPGPDTTTIHVWNPNSPSVLKTESPYPWDGLSNGAELLDLDEFEARAKDFVDTTTIIHTMDNDTQHNVYLVYAGRLPEEPYASHYTVANITYAGWGHDIDGTDLIGDEFTIRLGFNAIGGGFYLIYFLPTLLTLAIACAVALPIILSSRKPPLSAEDKAEF